EHSRFLSEPDRFPYWMAYVVSAQHPVFSPDGRELWEVLTVPVIRDAATGVVRARVPPSMHRPRDYAFSPDGRLAASTHADHHLDLSLPEGKGLLYVRFTDRVVRLWDLSRGRFTAILRGHQRRVNTVAFSPDGKQVVTASDDQTARVWDVATAKEVRVLLHDSAVGSAVFSPDGRRILAVSTGCLVKGGDYPTGVEGKGG